MKDPFKTRKMHTVPVPMTVPPASPSSPAASRPPSSMGPPSSDSQWSVEASAQERTTDPAVVAVQLATSGGKDRATLTLLSGINAGQVFALDATEHVIGRGTEADLWLDDNGVSRRHARVTVRSDGRYFVEDLGSTNGTFVGGQRVELSEIRPGERLQCGPTAMFRFAITDDAEEELQRRLYESSTRDALTRAYNRKYLGERMLAEVAYSRRHKVKLSVLMIDLDDFKKINDTYGHLAGDMVLRLVAAQVQKLIRAEDLLARYGGEELIVLARATGKTEAARLGERIRASIEGLELPIGDTSIKVTLSMGVAALPDVAPDGGATELIGLADARLYRAKADGKNRVCAEGEA